MNLPSCSYQNIEVGYEHISEIVNACRRALESCEENLEIWKSRTVEYNDLKSNLQSICQEIDHKVMVPFGNCAFMPGKMVHTNEILVLLGDNWFVERSTHQAVDIVNRRLDYCSEMVKKLEEEKQFHENKIKLVQQLSGEIFNDQVVEIRENLDDSDSGTNKDEEEIVLQTITEEEEKVTGENIDVAENGTISASSETFSQPRKVDEADFQALMKHLDELMKKEQEEDEAFRTDDESEDDSISSTECLQQNIQSLINPEFTEPREDLKLTPEVAEKPDSNNPRKLSSKRVTWNEPTREPKKLIEAAINVGIKDKETDPVLDTDMAKSGEAIKSDDSSSLTLSSKEDNVFNDQNSSSTFEYGNGTPPIDNMAIKSNVQSPITTTTVVANAATPAVHSSTSSSGSNNSLKSILKNRRESSPIDHNLLMTKSDEVVERGPVILPGSLKAFSGVISEKSPEFRSGFTTIPSNIENATPPKRRISKFRVQRSTMQ